MTTLAIIGAAGRMGKNLIRCASQLENLKVVAAIEQQGNPDVGKDAGLVAGINEIGVKITDNPKAVADSDVLIDFTFHTGVPETAKLAAELGKAMVIGTTGLNDDESAAIRKAAKKVAIVWAPNMSVGVNLLFSEVKKAASVLGTNYHVEIDETHHIHKKDAPSGTALRLGEKVAEGLGQDFKDLMIHDPEGADNRHDKGKIIIRSHREGEVVGDHTVSFENEGEKLELIHHAWSRDAFALGALRAAQWVLDRKPGLYDMQDVLKLSGSDLDNRQSPAK